MGKALYLGVSGKARKGKKAYIGVSGKARKIKKIYIGDANGKARLGWSGMGKFLYQIVFNVTTSTGTSFPKNSLLSDDGLTWSKSSGERPQNFQDIIFAKGKFWGVYCNYQTAIIYSSVDGHTWTLVKAVKSSSYFGYNSIIRYENGVFIVHGEYSSSSNFMCYSTDGVNWTCVKYNGLHGSYTMSGAPLDIKYGTVNGVSGWYVLASDKSNVTMVYRFKTLSDLTSGTPEAFARTTVRSNRGILDLRNDTLYALFAYYTGTIENTSHTILLYSYKTSWTQLGRVTGQTIGSMWITDKTIAVRGVWWSDAQMSWSVHYAQYNYVTGTFTSGTASWYGQTTRTKITAFVDGRMWQITDGRGAYSDDYGTTVTRFTPTTETLSSASTYEMLVYGDENYGYYRE